MSSFPKGFIENYSSANDRKGRSHTVSSLVRNDVPLKDTAFSIDFLSANVIYAALQRTFRSINN